MVVSLVTIQALTVGASTPEEVAGPALAVTVKISNNSSAAVSVSSVWILDTHGQVATPTTASPAAPFMAPIQPGASANGVYVFGIAENQRNSINVFVSYGNNVGAATAHFTGNAS